MFNLRLRGVFAFFSMVFFVSNALAGIVSYRIDAFGVVQDARNGRFYEADDDLESFWLLDDLNNTVELFGQQGAGTRTLNADLFSVADILDVTWSGADYSWVYVSDGLSYRLDALGIIQDSRNGRFYEADDDLENYWLLDDVNNTVELFGQQGTGTRTLNTELFSVADILDVTWSGVDSSWVSVKGGLSYRIDAFGNIKDSREGRFYEADDDIESYWLLDDVNNTVELFGQQGTGTRTLNTDLFSVVDILDVTWSGGDSSWITVEVHDLTEVPEPSSIVLFGLGILVVWTRRFKNQRGHPLGSQCQ